MYRRLCERMKPEIYIVIFRMLGSFDPNILLYLYLQLKKLLKKLRKKLHNLVKGVTISLQHIQGGKRP